MVDLDPLVEGSDQQRLRNLIEWHFRHTRSRVAERILEKWEPSLTKFVKVMPRDYKRALMGLDVENSEGSNG